MRGRWAAIGLALLAACSNGNGDDCDTAADCVAPRPADLVVLGEVESIGDDGVVRFLLDEEQTLDVRVQGSLAGLLEDVRYRVPLYGADDGGPPSAAMPTGCDCVAETITLPDGSEVHVAEPSSGLRAVAAAVLGGAAVVVAAWGALRWHRGEPL